MTPAEQLPHVYNEVRKLMAAKLGVDSTHTRCALLCRC